MESMLIRNARFVLAPGKVLENHDILVEDGKISKMGRGLKGDDVIDASGKLVMPGLINTHTHSPMVLFRGAGDDMPLMDWLQKRIWPLEAKLTKEDIKAGAKLALAEMIRSGTTCFCDMYWHMEQIAEAVTEAGMKAVLSWAVVNKDMTTQKEEPLKAAEAFIQQWRGKNGIYPSVGPHAIYTCSKETLLAAKCISEKYGVLEHFHLSETKKELDDCMKSNGMRPAEYLKSIDFFTHGALAAHCVWLSDDEIRILARAGVSASHCPASNMKLASGVMPLKRMHDAGVNITLGTDGAASNNTLDMFDAMRLTAFLHKVEGTDPTAAKARDVLRMATANGAWALGLNSGEIAPKKDADLLILDIDRPHWKPAWDPVSNLVYSAKSADVDTVICSGRVVMAEGEIVTFDEKKAIRDAEEAKAKLG